MYMYVCMHPYMLFKCIHVIKSRFSKYLKIFIHFFSGKNVIRPEESLYVTSAAKYPGYHPEVKDEDWDVTDSSVGKRVHNIASASISQVACISCQLKYMLVNRLVKVSPP